jgi:translation initiation factor eIF-2B subunit alpha
MPAPRPNPDPRRAVQPHHLAHREGLCVIVCGEAQTWRKPTTPLSYISASPENTPMASAVTAYAAFLEGDPAAGPSTAAIKALTGVIKDSGATTMMGLREALREAGEALSKRQDAPMSIASLCELFVRFITRTALTSSELDFDAMRGLLIERGQMLAKTTLEARSKIANVGAKFIEAGGVVLTHGVSRCVVALLLKAARTKHFSVIVAESHPDGDGHQTAKQLAEAGVPVTIIEDAAVAHAMSRCQMVLCGAEAVLESGGVISKTGTYQMAIVAAACNKPCAALPCLPQAVLCSPPPLPPSPPSPPSPPPPPPPPQRQKEKKDWQFGHQGHYCGTPHFRTRAHPHPTTHRSLPPLPSFAASTSPLSRPSSRASSHSPRTTSQAMSTHASTRPLLGRRHRRGCRRRSRRATTHRPRT